MKPYNVKWDLVNQQLGFYDQSHVFANVYQLPIVWEGIEYLSTEHAYQATKLSQHPELVARLMNEEDPEAVANLGQAHSHLAPADWNERKVDLMRDLIRAKVNQHLKVYRILIRSKGWFLYENSPKDKFWGMVNGEGENMIGRILMELRLELLLVNAYNSLDYGSLPQPIKNRINSSDDFIDFSAAVIIQRAKFFGIAADQSRDMFAILADLEERYLQDLVLQYQLPTNLPKAAQWEIVSQLYAVHVNNLTPAEASEENTRMQLAKLLQLNKFTASWSEIEQALANI